MVTAIEKENPDSVLPAGIGWIKISGSISGNGNGHRQIPVRKPSPSQPTNR